MSTPMSTPTTTARTIGVDLAGRSYDIAIGPGLIDRAGALSRPLLAAPKVTIVSDETVAPIYGARLAAARNTRSASRSSGRRT